MAHGAAESVCRWIRGDEEAAGGHPRLHEQTPWPGWIDIQRYTALQDVSEQELAERQLASIWIFLADHDEWRRLIVPLPGIVLGAVAQWFVMQGVIAIHGWQIQDLAFFWYADITEETELALVTFVEPGSWLRLRFRLPDAPEDDGEPDIARSEVFDRASNCATRL